MAKEEALASGNLSEDDPVKMRAKKLKSDDGNGERRNATGGAEGVKYAATTAREREGTRKVERTMEGRWRVDQRFDERRRKLTVTTVLWDCLKFL